MDKSIVRSLVTLALGSAAYYGATAAALPWAPLLAVGMPSYLILQLANAVVLVGVSTPFALLLGSGLVKVRFPVLLAAAVALLGLVAPLLSELPLPLRPGVAGASAAIDLVKFATVLPFLTWVAARRLASSSSSRPKSLHGSV